jgi:hypothetical protein
MATGFVRLRAALTVIFFLLLLVQFLAYSANASTSPAANSHAAAPTDAKANQGAPGAREPLTDTDIGLVAASALIFAWLRIYKSFHRYKGLLPYVFVEWPGWVFGLFTATLAFVPDYTILPFFAHFLGEFGLPGDMIGHTSLMAVHVGISGVSAVAGPIILGFPGLVGIQHAAADKPKSEPATEMNVVFAAIRESLDNHAHGAIINWTSEYSWPVIKLTAKTMITDLSNAETMSPEDAVRARQEIDAFKKCDDDLDDKQAKYELLRKMMNRTSFNDLQTRLEHVRKAL